MQVLQLLLYYYLIEKKIVNRICFELVAIVVLK